MDLLDPHRPGNSSTAFPKLSLKRFTIYDRARHDGEQLSLH